MFRELGYVVSGDGAEFVAERKWRTVRVRTVCAADAERPGDVVTDAVDDTDLHCYVTWTELTADLRDRLRALSPPGDWAVIGVDGEGNHEVLVDAA